MLEELIRRFEKLRDEMAAGKHETISVIFNEKDLKAMIFFLNQLKDKITKEQMKGKKK